MRAPVDTEEDDTLLALRALVVTEVDAVNVLVEILLALMALVAIFDVAVRVLVVILLADKLFVEMIVLVTLLDVMLLTVVEVKEMLLHVKLSATI